MSGNFDVFHALDEEKKQRIIKSALAEFAGKGFKRASTNVIAENAKIGKGMLFYYFGSKEELFDFLCEYVIEFAKNEYAGQLNSDSGDFLERHKVLTEAKRRLMSGYGEFFVFFEEFYKDENAPHFEKYKIEIAELRELIYGKIYDGIDYALFREDLNGAEVVKYLTWLMNGYEAETAERVKNGGLDVLNEAAVKEEWAKFYSFTDDLRRIFYKEGDTNGNK
ncbi:TetR family transcriptional regulator [Clostridia bacterium]|nr:TetR family transcriptional regulator [Clostridia bacterium]